MYHNPLFTKTFYLCEITDEQLLWRNYNRVFDKLYVFYCVVNRNFLNTFYFWSGKKYCCTVICEYGSFYWIISSWINQNGFERKRVFMIQISNFTRLKNFARQTARWQRRCSCSGAYSWDWAYGIWICWRLEWWMICMRRAGMMRWRMRMRFWRIKKISMSFRNDCGDFLFLVYLVKEMG